VIPPDRGNARRRTTVRVGVTVESPTPEAPSGPNRRLVSIALGLAAVAALALLIINPGGSAEEAVTDLGGFSFLTVDGGETTLDAYAGSPLVVNYFAAWCGPCRAEMPAFEAVSREVAADGVVFLGVSRDNDITSWKSFVAETGVTYETVFEGAGAGTFEEVGAMGMPTTVFITSQGTVAEVFSGLLPEQTLRDKIEEHLIGG
jgi:thiol-disulfide isomerase/thioredoxin